MRRWRECHRRPGCTGRRSLVDAEAISDIDTTAVEEIHKLEAELEKRDVKLVFARLDVQARKALIDAGVSLEGGDYGRIIDAVEALKSGPVAK